ncbi:carboxymuconolactone decarboxylase family protein [Actinomadura soli]|uniref:Carboxymuconolactone decarboxylase family protein n=1 Tax=Actinomadura soli TaxID=2508997 RepID=A0A5C4J0P4_9ACTN|nr:carboxymuconolactone decarboxylase family protein [Actinomadura soli]TMQ90042.1 carboxymuconolactone decarboxylase family protein [Actinomadura soli]
MTNAPEIFHSSRVDFAVSAPRAFKALISFDAAARDGLDPALVELVQIRASQLNGCAYCLHLHTADARKAGENQERLHMVQVWQDAAHFFTPDEQAALALTEAITQITGGVPDDVYRRATDHFDDTELAQLIAVILTINTWNRIAVTTTKTPGTDERR